MRRKDAENFTSRSKINTSQKSLNVQSQLTQPSFKLPKKICDEVNTAMAKFWGR